MPSYPVVFTDGNVLFDTDLDNTIGHREYRNQKGSVLAHGTISVAVTATLVVGANTDRTYVIVRNVATNDIYIGGSGVTTSNGYLLRPNDSLIIVLDTTAVYAVSGTASQDLRYMEVDSP